MKRYIKSNLSTVMAGTRYDKNAAKILSDSGLFDAETSNKIIQTLFTEDISAFNHAPNWLEKYLKGIARIIIEESQGNPEKASEFIEKSTKVFDTYIAYVRKLRDKLGGAEYDKQFVEKMSFADVQQEIKNLEKDYYDELDIVSNASGYTLIPIKDYNEMHSMFGGHWTGDGTDRDGQYAGHGGTSWCHTNHESTYNSWVHGGNEFFVLAANNWKDIPFNEESNEKNAKDEYGNSLIAILVDKNGNLDRATPRSNHVGHLEGHADHQYNYQQLSAIAGFDVEAAVKETLEIQFEKVDTSEFIYYNSKYGMVRNSAYSIDGHVLYQIKALRSFGSGQTSVQAGDIGGYIENLDNLSEDGNCWVYGDAAVLESAKVTGNARISGYARVHGNARVANSAIVGDRADISGNAKISGNAIIGQEAAVDENAKVFGNAVVYEKALVTGSSWVFGTVHMWNQSYADGDARIFGDANIFGNAIIKGHASVCDNAVINDHAEISDNASVYDKAHIWGNAVVSGNAEVFGDANIYGESHISGNAKVDYEVYNEDVSE